MIHVLFTTRSLIRLCLEVLSLGHVSAKLPTFATPYSGGGRLYSGAATDNVSVYVLPMLI